jgi:hypothetical protein
LVVGLNLLIDYHVGAAAIARSFAGYLRQLAAALPGATHAVVILSVVCILSRCSIQAD